MPNLQLVSYIKSQLAQGFTKEQLIPPLQQAGWSQADIEQAFSSIEGETLTIQATASQSRGDNENKPKLPGVFALLANAWGIYQKIWKTYLAVLFLPLLTLLILLIIFLGLLLLTQRLDKETVSSIFINRPFISTILFLATFLVITFISTLVQIAMTLTFVEHENRLNFKEILKKSARKIFSYIWINLLGSLIIFGGLILFIIPGILFSLWFSMSAFVLLSENVKGMNALLKSKAYVKNYVLALIGRLIALGSIVLPFYILSEIFENINHESSTITIYQLIFTLLSIFIFTPLSLGYSYSIFDCLKKIKPELQTDFEAKTKSKILYLSAGLFGVIVILTVFAAVILLSQSKPAINQCQRCQPYT